MEVLYALIVLLLYIVVLVFIGVTLSEHSEQKKKTKKSIAQSKLTNREKLDQLNEVVEPFGFAYEEKQDIFYSRFDGWQRKYGYGRIYDEAAVALNMILDSEPVYFEYDDKKWMIEFWKGQYGITTGGEVGIYYLPKSGIADDLLKESLIYQSVEDKDTLRIKMILWKNGKQLYARRGYHWWLTGFVLGEFSKPKELEMDIEITLKDVAMREAFLQGLREAGYREEELTYYGTTVRIHFDKPHTRQPLSRKGVFSIIKQMENKRNCRRYQRIVNGYANAYDKTQMLQARSPKLYRKLERLGTSRFTSKEKQNE